MTLDLSGIIHAQGEKLVINGNFDLDPSYSIEGWTFLSPLQATGFLQNFGESLEFSAKVTAKLQTDCDRCGRQYDQEIEFEIFEVLKKNYGRDEVFSDEASPDVISFLGMEIEIDEIVYKNLFMNLPMKNLCSAECLGLCTVCGKNLNEGDCGCDRSTIDPRLAILDEFK